MTPQHHTPYFALPDALVSVPGPPAMPERVRELYEEEDRCRAVIEDEWATEDARARAYRDLADVEAALTNCHA